MAHVCMNLLAQELHLLLGGWSFFRAHLVLPGCYNVIARSPARRHMGDMAICVIEQWFSGYFFGTRTGVNREIYRNCPP